MAPEISGVRVAPEKANDYIGWCDIKNDHIRPNQSPKEIALGS